MHIDSALQVSARLANWVEPFDPEQLPRRHQVNTLLGNSAELHPLVLRSLFARVARAEQVGVILGDNRFDAYGLAYLGRAHQIEPYGLLARMEISREFTCHQLHHGVTNLSRAKIFEWSALYVLGFLELFYDEDIQEIEAQQLFGECLARLKEFAADGLPILISIDRPPSTSNRQAFVQTVIENSDAYWEPSAFALSEPILQQFEFAIMDR